MDQFPEAFRRFQKTVNTDKIKTWDQMRLAFRYWAGHRWVGSPRQLEALKIEAEKIGIPTEPIVTRTWRREIHIIRGRPQNRWRNLKNGRFIKNPMKQ